MTLLSPGSISYPMFGFEPACEDGILPPAGSRYGPQWMVRRLPAHRPELRGRFAYPDAFSE